MFWEQCLDWCVSQEAQSRLAGGPFWTHAQRQACEITCERNLTIALYAGGFLIALGVVIYIAVRLAIGHSTGTRA